MAVFSTSGSMAIPEVADSRAATSRASRSISASLNGGSRTSSRALRSAGRRCSSVVSAAGVVSLNTTTRPDGDGGQHLIEQGCGRSLVRAARRELQEVRDIPEHPLFDRELGGEAVEALFELAEVLLPGHQARRAGLEHGPALRGRAHRQQDQKARLSRAGFADDEHRSKWARSGRQSSAVASCSLMLVVLEQQLLVGVRFDEPAERLQERAIQRVAPPGGQRRQEGCADGCSILRRRLSVAARSGGGSLDSASPNPGMSPSSRRAAKCSASIAATSGCSLQYGGAMQDERPERAAAR